MIPKTIHYCWFGGNPLPDEAKKCIDSWKKYFPGYEIREWNESNFNLEICPYVQEAYEKKKWAFVSDYARFFILYNFGGVYFDTDVEVVKSMQDIIEKGPFMGMEKGTIEELRDENLMDLNEVKKYKGVINPGLGIAAEPGLAIYKEILDKYNERHFISDSGEIDTYTVCDFITSILHNYKLSVVEGKGYTCGLTVYPVEFFCPKDYTTGELKMTENTRSIHHYSETWVSPVLKKINLIERKYARKYGENDGYKKSRKATLLLRIIYILQTRGIYNTIKSVINQLDKK